MDMLNFKCAFAVGMLTLAMVTTLVAQQEEQGRPRWWFGPLLGANNNLYDAHFHEVNATTRIPAGIEFEEGFGVRPALGLILEYRPLSAWGGSFKLLWDGRGGAFDEVSTPGGLHKFSTGMNYISLEPNVRVAPFDFPLHFFAGPRFGFNVGKSFRYEHPTTGTREGDWSNVRGTNIGGQVGVGYDWLLSSPQDKRWIELSPFVSAHFSQQLRTVDKWNNTTIRAGVALKFGTPVGVLPPAARTVEFSVRAPQVIPGKRTVEETFPLRNYVFFDAGSTEIPARYVRLSAEQAAKFREEHLFASAPTLTTGRSRKQLDTYYNILNVIGDRLRRYPNAAITLTGASSVGAHDGKQMAENIKRYLVDVFGIAANRITTAGATRPAIPSSQPGGTRDVALVQAEDRRVDITSETLDILLPVRITSEQEDPLDADVVFSAAGAEELLASWTLEVRDQEGTVRNFGPFTSSQERISGKTLLGDRTEASYTVSMRGQTRLGQAIERQGQFRLTKAAPGESELALRFSILFEFDQSKTVATYEHFLTQTVAPAIPDGANVVIHGHTDIVGEESYNLKLSRDRANEAMRVLQQGLTRLGRRGVRFDTVGFGEDPRRAPFENHLPEERFYNRTVMIEIVP
jgi:outer membrane protein OmpA-like peptidoglycan-associated protein